MKLLKFLDIFRIMAVSAAFFFGYQIGFQNGYDPTAQLHFMIPVIIIAIAGLSGLEGLLFGNQAARLKGFEAGSNYQKQSAYAMLSLAFVATLIWFLNWGIKAELTLLFNFLLFFLFSAINHSLDAMKRKNFKWQNINRPFITLLLIAGLFYPVYMVLKSF